MDHILNNLPDAIALLDRATVICESNTRWEQQYPQTTGLNFLKFYMQEADRPDDQHVQEGIYNIIAGQTDCFSCLFTTRNKKFAMQIAPVHIGNSMKMMVSLRDISALETDTSTQLQIEQLTETNMALNILLKRREDDRVILEGAIVTNVKQLIMPYMERLEQAPLAPREQTLVAIIKEYLDNVISPFLHRISTINQQLTPQELKIASLIRQGRSTQEIAEALHLSVNGVGFHRKNLRKKLGLTGSGKNLRSQLMALR